MAEPGSGDPLDQRLGLHPQAGGRDKGGVRHPKAKAKKGRLSDVEIGKEAGIAALLRAIEVIGKHDKKSMSYDRGNMLLSMAIGVLLNQSRNISTQIADRAISVYVDAYGGRPVPAEKGDAK